MQVSAQDSGVRARTGQSLVEVLLAVALGAIFLVAGVSVIAPSLQSNAQAARVQTAASLGKELLDNVRVWADGNWNNVLSVATGTTNIYYLNTSSSPFVAATGTESIVISTSSASSSINLNSGLIGYWKFDEGSGMTTYDSSGNGNNGTWSGTPPYYAGGVVGPYAGFFNGTTTNDVVSLGTPTILNLTPPFTASAWVYVTSTQSGVGMMGNGNWDVSGFTFGINSGYPHVEISQSGTAQTPQANTLIPLNQWVNVGFVASGTVGSFYLNGVAVGTGAIVAPAIGSSVFYLGKTAQGGWNPMRGLLDDVRIYNRALSAAEFSQLYTLGQSSLIYGRSFSLSDVYRDASGNIVTSGGIYDPSTKLVTVSYGWPRGPSYTVSAYVVRGRNKVLVQNDWSGGPGVTSTAQTSTNNQFASSTGIDYSSSTGKIQVSIPGW